MAKTNKLAADNVKKAMTMMKELGKTKQTLSQFATDKWRPVPKVAIMKEVFTPPPSDNPTEIPFLAV